MAHRSEGDPGQDHRGLDMVNPVFNLLDMTPEDAPRGPSEPPRDRAEPAHRS